MHVFPNLITDNIFNVYMIYNLHCYLRSYCITIATTLATCIMYICKVLVGKYCSRMFVLGDV